MRMRPTCVHWKAAGLVAGLLVAAWPKVALATTDGLKALRARVAEDVRAGRPLVAQVHLALCDNRIIRCGGSGRGDGDQLARNLYWATGGGFRGWFDRRGSGWRPVSLAAPGAADADVLAVRAWRRTVRPGGAFARELGLKRPLPVIVVVHAWRGLAIGRAARAYADDLLGESPRALRLADGTTLHAGGAAHVVAFVGHNHWMDVSRFDWRPPRRDGAARRPKGTIAVGCLTAQYLARHLSAPGRVPLLLVRDFVFAGAHSFEGALAALAAGGSLAEVRAAAARAYAEGQRTSYRRVAGAFVNPAAPHWGRYVGARPAVLAR